MNRISTTIACRILQNGLLVPKVNVPNEQWHVKTKITNVDVGSLSCKWEVFKDEVKPRNDNSDNLYTIKDDFK